MMLRRNFCAMNASDPLHWTQDSCFGAFRTVSLLHENRCKTCQTGAINAQVRKTKLRHNFSQRTYPIHSIGPKAHILGHFAPFRYYTKVVAKRAELVPLTHKFAKRSYVAIFCNERTRDTPLHPNLMFWVVSHRFITARKSVQNRLNWTH
jgi:hypothetical protein